MSKERDMTVGRPLPILLSFILPLLLGLLTALCDETIQLFVEGRSGQISDVWLDAAGIATGALLIWIFRRK